MTIKGNILYKVFAEDINSDGIFNFPTGITNIGFQAFLGCTKLTTITIPDSVTIIGKDAFWTCTNLTKITIPDTIQYIGSNAFEHCDSLEEIIVPDYTIGTTKNLTKEKIEKIFKGEKINVI